MNKVVVIGPTYRTEIIKATKTSRQENHFSCACSHFNAGGCYSIAYNLAILRGEVDFISRIAYDQISTEMMMNLEEKNIAIHTHIYDLGKIPTRIYFYDINSKLTIYDDFSYNIYPSLEDGLPFIRLDIDDYCVIDVANAKYVNAILNEYQQAHFVSINNIPTDEELTRMDGLIISDSECLKYVQSYDFGTLAKSLIEKGLKWVIIDNPGSKVRIYTPTYNQELIKEEYGDNLIGTQEVFISELVHCLSNNFNLIDAANYALELSNNKTFKHEITL